MVNIDIKAIEEEFDSCMQAAYDEIACHDFELAEEFFGDAAYVIRDLDEENKQRLLDKYSINPMDFAY